MPTGWRTVQTLHGDTLQNIALRELLNASRWPEIAWLNNLRPPYLTGNRFDPAVEAGALILYGSPIRVPSAHSVKQPVTPSEAFGIDVVLVDGLLCADPAGGLSLAKGVPNLRQALTHRLRCALGCLPFHPKYGNLAHRLKGRKADQTAALLAMRFCEESVLSDPRVKSVSGAVASNVGDSIVVELTAMVDNGSTLRLQVEI